MFEHQEHTSAPSEQVAVTATTEAAAELPATAAASPEGPGTTPSLPLPEPALDSIKADALAGGEDWHAEAGRKGAQRVQQLIEEGKLYEQEHGLKRGRQRLRQLIELGKRYEQEHDLRPRRPGKRRERLGRGQRKELLATLLRCLVRLSKPSFRAELGGLIQALQDEAGRPA